MKKSIINTSKILLGLSIVPASITAGLFSASCSDNTRQIIIGQNFILTYTDFKIDGTVIGGSGGAKYSTNAHGKATWEIRQDSGLNIPNLDVVPISDNTCFLSWHAINDWGRDDLTLISHVEGYKDAYYHISFRIDWLADDLEDSWVTVGVNLMQQSSEILSEVPWDPHYLQADSQWFNKPDQWMSGLNENDRIIDVNIPGTHDSTTRYTTLDTVNFPGGNFAPGWSQDQAYTTTELLDNGMRTFDIRTSDRYGTGLDRVCCHDVADCWTDESRTIPLTERRVLDDIYNWLNKPEHKQEVVFIRSYNTEDYAEYFSNKGKSDMFYGNTTCDTTFKNIWDSSSGDYGRVCWFPPTYTFNGGFKPQWAQILESSLNWNRLAWEIPWKITQLVKVINGYYKEQYEGCTDIDDAMFEIDTNSTAWNPNVLRNDPRKCADLTNKILVNLELPESFIGTKIGWLCADTADGNLSDAYNIAKKVYLTNQFVS